jgi:flotillin
VPTNDVHVVQRSHSTRSFGAGSQHGNVYYRWPAWMPIIGCKVRIFSVANFDLSFNDYEAYDAARLPFQLDIQCFFRIEDTNMAAKKVESMQTLCEHLRGIVQGAVRSLLAKAQLEEIMTERSKYGEDFTESIKDELAQWGVVAVKNIELMDIRDSKNENVIANIMAKKKSEIEKESRATVAKNQQEARTAEIESQKNTQLKQQESEQLVGEQRAETDKRVGIANEKAKQEIEEQARMTAEKKMAVQKVNTIKASEITKEAAIITAEQNKVTAELRAEADKAVVIKNSEARRAAAEKDAEAVKLQKAAEAKGIVDVGTSRAEAERLAQLATVSAQIELATKISKDQAYQDYLVKIKQIEVDGEVRKAQALALERADLRIITNAGDIQSGINKLGEVFTPKGGTALGGALEALAQTEMGQKLAEKIVGAKKDPKRAKTVVSKH